MNLCASSRCSNIFSTYLQPRLGHCLDFERERAQPCGLVDHFFFCSERKNCFPSLFSQTCGGGVGWHFVSLCVLPSDADSAKCWGSALSPGVLSNQHGFPWTASWISNRGTRSWAGTKFFFGLCLCTPVQEPLWPLNLPPRGHIA